MKKSNENHVLKTVSIVFLSLLALFLIIAIVLTIKNYNKRFYKLDIDYENNSVVDLTNKLPMSDEIGKNYNGVGVEKGIAEYKKITITNKNKAKVNYEIYLTKIHKEEKDIRSNYIKLYLTDEKNNPIKGFNKKQVISYYDLLSLNDKPGSKLLYSGSLANDESDTFILRSWVADTYLLSNEEESFEFNIDIRMK